MSFTEKIITLGDVSQNLSKYLNNPDYKRALVEVLNKPDLKQQLANILFSDETRVNSWELFYKKFDKLKEGELSFLQLYLILYKNKTSEEVGYIDNSFNKAKLQIEFENIKRENLRQYIYNAIISNPKIKSGNDINNLMIKIDEYIKNNQLDLNNDGHLDNDELVKIVQDITGMLTNSKEKGTFDKVLEQIMKYNFDIAHNFGYTIEYGKGNKVLFESLDRHLPETTNQDFSKILNSVIKPLINYKGWNPDNKDINGNNKTQDNLKTLIIDFFEKNKEQLNEYGIDSIYDISPANATKLVSMMTMYYLSYNNSQAIDIKDESSYLSGLSSDEKKEYLKNKNEAIELVLISEKFKKQYSEYKNHKLLDFLFYSMGNNQVVLDYLLTNKNNFLPKNGFSKKEKERILKDYLNEVNTVYTKKSSLYNRNLKVDKLPIDRLLKGGKGVCRNYATANEKLFDTLKSMQLNGFNELKNSTLVRYVDISLGNDKKQTDLSSIGSKEAIENRFDNHAWNLLVTIDKDGIVHKTQIDSTWADMDKRKIYGNVKQLDRTFDRLLQEISRTSLKSVDLVSNLLKLSQSLQINNDGSPIFGKIMSTIIELLNSKKVSFKDFISLLGDNEGNFSIRANLSKYFINIREYNKLKSIWGNSTKTDVTIKLMIAILTGEQKIINKIKQDGIDLKGYKNRDDFIKRNYGFIILSESNNPNSLNKFTQIFGELYDNQVNKK